MPPFRVLRRLHSQLAHPFVRPVFSHLTTSDRPAPIKGPDPVRTLLGSLPATILSPLAATLVGLPVNVVNKGLTAKLNPLDATSTENRGVPLEVSASHIRPIADKRFWCNNSQKARDFFTIR